MKKKTNKIYANILALACVQMANYLAPLLVLPYLSRVLGINGFGLVVITFSVIAICFVVSDFGFNLSSPNWIAQNKGDKREVSIYISSVFYLKVLFLFPLVIFICIYYVFFLNISNQINMMIACIIAVISQAFIPVWFFQGIEKMRLITVFWVISKILYLMLVLLFVKREGQEYIVIICFGISNIAATVIAIYFIYRSGYRFVKPPFHFVVKVFKDNIYFFLSRAAVGLYTSASTFIVGSYAGVAQAALYSSAEKLYQAGQSVTSPVSQALYPYLSRTGDLRTFYKFLGLCFVAIVLGVIVTFFFSKEIMLLFYGEDFAQGYKLLRVFLVCSLINFIGVNFGYPAFSIINRLDLANKSVIIASLFYFVLLCALIITNNVTAYKVAVGVTCVEFIVMIMRVAWFMSELKYLRKSES